MKLQPGKRYTRSQIRSLVDQAEAHELQMEGYVLQHDVMSKTYAIVPWYEAGGGEQFGELRQDKRMGKGVFDPLDPIQRRSPADRTDSLMLRFIGDMKKAGGLPTIQTGIAPRVNLPDGSSRPPTADEQDEYRRRRHREIEENELRIKEIVGEAWKSGRTEITADIVRQVASHFLGQSDKEHEKKLSKQITRHED